MFSKGCSYVISSVLLMAQKSKEGEKVLLKEILKNRDISYLMTAKLMQDLVSNDILVSKKGKGGGYSLNKNSKDINLMDIVNVVDNLTEAKISNKCFMGINECSCQKPCVFHTVYKDFKDGLINVLTNKSIKDLVEDINQKKAFV